MRTPTLPLILSCSLLGSVACGVGAGELGAAQESAGSAERDTSGEAEEGDPIPAGGISIVEVELNQGTRVPIGVGGDWIDLDQRSNTAIAARDAVIRVHYSVDADWVPREVEARLSLMRSDGSSESLADVRMVEGSSQRGDLDGPFLFRLESDDGQTQAGAQFQVELWDRHPSAGESFELRTWTSPAAGHRPIGFEAVPLQLDLVMVPIEYQGEVVALDEELLLGIVGNLYEQNPVTQISWEVHEPVPHAGQLNSLSSLLPVMAQLRSDEGADPNAYYHALIDVGSQSLGGVFGISYGANDTKDDAGSRVSATVVWSIDPTIAIETFTHEIGHAQGLGHVACPSAVADDPDPSFPNSSGQIGDWGFGVERMQVYDPAEVYDYMSYCGPSWVSDWTWRRTYARIETLTAWDFEGAGPGQLLVGAVQAGRDAEPSWVWWTMPGGVDARRRSSTERFEFETSEGARVVSYADVAELSDRQTRWVKVQLPVDVGELTSIRYVGRDQAVSIDPAVLIRAD
ncbi:zinc-dependent metalloprotease family protein [Enhygromyxa salina]|uniref:Uncharacterized protein n=1 Tax=Enhygromyxa salina TaxID=215803 RepID=A0A2S9YQR5_9BACT|nr:hypothetical protein [Enhygromyxa salina]PRQ07444.1 hypothetical protein ENSA7_28370 [Enhygromyxa salina]